MDFKLTIAALAVIGALLFLSGCIQPSIPQCGDNICDQTLEANPQLPSYCQQDCGIPDTNNEIPVDSNQALDTNARIESRIFTSSAQASVSDFAFCGSNCISFAVNQTPLINGEFWVKITSNENENLMIELRQANCSAVSNTIKCVSDQILTLDKSKIYAFTANIPVETTANAAAEEPSITPIAYFSDISQDGPVGNASITASGEICASCDSSKLNDGSQKLTVNGSEVQAQTEIVCSATSSTTAVNPLVWKFVPLGGGDARFTAPKAQCVESFNGWVTSLGKFIVVSGTGQQNNFGAWITEYPTAEIVYGDNYAKFGMFILGSANSADDAPNMVMTVSDDLGEVHYDQTYFSVWGVPFNTPLTPRADPPNNPSGHSTENYYSVVYPKSMLKSHFGSAGKVKYSLIFDGVNTQAKKPIPTSASFFASADNDPLTIQTNVYNAPNNLIAKFNLKEGSNGFEKEITAGMTLDQLYQDPSKGLVIKLNNQTGNADAQWVYTGDELKLSSLTALYKVKVVIGSNAAQGKTPKFSFYVNDEAWEIASGVTVYPKANSDRHPSNGNTKTYELFLSPPAGSPAWDGGYNETGLGFRFRMFHYDDAGADPNAMIWLESMEFYGPDGTSYVPNCGNGTLDTGEKCDLANLDGKTCINMGFASGTLSCKSSCDFDTSNCTGAGGFCGNSKIDSKEQCDLANLNGKTCENTGFTGGGTLSCNADCTLNTGKCIQAPPACGNNSIDAGEQCDGSNLNGKTCDSLGYASGTPACNSNCTFNVSNCQVLRNSGFETWENGLPKYWSALNSYSSSSSKIEQSTDKVEGSKSAKITSKSTTFGLNSDGFIVQGGDTVTVKFNAKAGNSSRPYKVTLTAYPYGGTPAYPGPHTATVEGSNTSWQEKTLTYTAPEGKNNASILMSIKNVDYDHTGTAFFDNFRISITRNNATSCVKPFVRRSSCDVTTSLCGDGTIAGYEQCEGTNFGGATCETYFKKSGTLTCDSGCFISTSKCIGCGDGVIQAGEDCEGTTSTKKCSDFGLYSNSGTESTIYCNACKLSMGGCTFPSKNKVKEETIATTGFNSNESFNIFKETALDNKVQVFLHKDKYISGGGTTRLEFSAIQSSDGKDFGSVKKISGMTSRNGLDYYVAGVFGAKLVNNQYYVYALEKTASNNTVIPVLYKLNKDLTLASKKDLLPAGTGIQAILYITPRSLRIIESNGKTYLTIQAAAALESTDNENFTITQATSAQIAELVNPTLIRKFTIGTKQATISEESLNGNKKLIALKDLSTGVEKTWNYNNPSTDLGFVFNGKNYYYYLINTSSNEDDYKVIFQTYELK
ncbi:MAG: hypothetical protein Q7R70_04650 [Candidatus Diapherotrites archaeon]|nr:hypothetical protein [Candidatus Diapherotrites archaeon]